LASTVLYISGTSTVNPPQTNAAERQSNQVSRLEEYLALLAKPAGQTKGGGQVTTKCFYAAALAAMLTFAGAQVLTAQEPEQDKEKQKQQEEEKKKKPQPKPDDKAKPEPKPDKEKAKPDAERRGQPDAQTSQGRNSQRGNNASTRRIPDDRYRASFGREHHFRVARRSDRRFEYEGYAFEYVDAWPSEWSYDDECYIVLDGDDYYLVDVVHPELRIRVIIVG
jgi:hypothetical protein